MEKINKIIEIDKFLTKLNVYKGKIYNYLDDLEDNIPKNLINVTKNNKEYFIKLKDNKYKIFNKPKENIIKLKNISNIYDIINSSCIVKIKDYKLSSTIFGYKKTKKEMFESNKSFYINDFHEDFICKKDNGVRHIVEISNGIKNLKFVLEDITIEYPDFDKMFKGFVPKKDRTIKNGSNVVFKLKHIDRNTYKVLHIESIGNKKFAHLVNDGIKQIKNIKELKLI